MSEIDPADLARLRSRRAWSEDAARTSARTAPPAAPSAPRPAPATSPSWSPRARCRRCEHCGETLSPDALRKAGYKPARS